mgnify:CR=1 FL=1
MLKKSTLLILFLILLMPLTFQKSFVGEVKGALGRSYITIPASADTYIASWDPASNFGDSTDINISFLDPGESIALIKFDLSSLPPDAVIIDGKMRLFLEGTGLSEEANLGIHRITNSWDESNITWNSAASLTTTPLGVAQIVDDNIGSYKDFTNIVDYIQYWIDNPSSNYGLMIRPSTSYGTFMRQFQSLDQMDATPYLELTYYQESIYHVLSGRVYQGNVGDETNPIEDVRLDLYCSTSSDYLGTWIDTTMTDPTGWYGLNGYFGCNYYNIVETDPEDYLSIGATTVHGVVISPNMIQYQAPLSGQIHTGNKFWDQLDTNGFDIFLPLIIK